MIESYLVRYFLAVVETGNFSRAASQVNVSQPTLSVGVAKLEASLGAKLFHRTNRRVHLTDAGAQFLIRARRVVHELNLAKEEIGGLKRPRLIRVGVLSTIPTCIIADAVAHHQRGGAAERIEILDGTARELTNLLDQGRIDVALTLGRQGPTQFEFEPLFSEGFALALSRHHRLADVASVDPEDLAADTMIVRRHCEVLSETSRFFTARNIRPEFAYRGISDDRVVALVCAGLGLTVMPNSYRHVELRRPRLNGFDYVREIGFQYAKDHRALVMDSAFLTALRQQLPLGGLSKPTDDHRVTNESGAIEVVYGRALR